MFSTEVPDTGAFIKPLFPALLRFIIKEERGDGIFIMFYENCLNANIEFNLRK